MIEGVIMIEKLTLSRLKSVWVWIAVALVAILIGTGEYLVRRPASDSAATAPPGAQADEARLFGTWHYNGGNCSIRFEGKQLTVINENGAPAVAGFQQILKVPLWNITGEISKDWKQIRWSNGTVWTR
jgi:hypothetical protein